MKSRQLSALLATALIAFAFPVSLALADTIEDESVGIAAYSASSEQDSADASLTAGNLDIEVPSGFMAQNGADIDSDAAPDSESSSDIVPQSSDYTYKTLTDGTISITAYNGSDTTISIPSTIDGKTVSAIADSAFSSYTLESINIPSTVTSIGFNAFGGCYSLTSITVDSGNTAFSSVNGVLFNAAKTKLITYPRDKADTTYSIPSTVTDIGSASFTYNTHLQTITFPGSVKTIGAGAFAYCSHLSTINLNEGLKSIGQYAFNLAAISTITIPSTVTSIDLYVFMNCSNLTSIAVASGNTAYCSKSGVLFDAAGKKLVAYPGGNANTAYSIPSGTTEIGESAFAYAAHLSTVQIPSSVTTLDDWCFMFSSITSMTIPATVTKMGNGPLDECSKLQSVDIKANVDALPYRTCFECTALQSAIIEKPITAINNQAFYGCTSLASVTLPDGLITIQPSAFSNCSSLASISFPSSLRWIAQWSFSGCTKLAAVVPDNVLAVYWDAFDGCKSATIPTSLTKIDDGSYIRAVKVNMTVTYDYDAAWKVLTLVNNERAKEGLPALSMDTSMLDSAMKRAAELVVYFSHTRPDGSSYDSAYSYTSTCGENIADGYSTPESVMTGWMNSSGHKANILGSSYTKIGIGCVIYNGTHYWVQGFSGGTATVPTKRTDQTSVNMTINKSFDRGDFKYYLNNATMTVSPNSIKYTGGALKPSATLYYQNIKLVEGYDYTISYSNNTNVGQATVTANASENQYLTGSKQSSFAIFGLWKRLYGDDRYDTMKAIVDEGFAANRGGYVIIANGQNFPDALTASGLAGIYNAPILLTTPEALADQTAQEIRRLGATDAIIVGGTSAVSQTTQNSIASILGSAHVTRKSGDSRYGTALEIYKAGRSSGWSNTAIIVSGGGAENNKFADALSISPYAFATKSPLFLANNDGVLESDAVTAIKNGGFKKILIIGGTSVVSENVKKQIGSGYLYTRLAGEDRYMTSSVIAKWVTGKMVSGQSFTPSIVFGYANACCASGGNFPDALAGGTLCGLNKSVMILVNDDSSGRYGITYNLAGNKQSIEQGYVLGGTAAVSADTYNFLESKTL